MESAAVRLLTKKIIINSYIALWLHTK